MKKHERQLANTTDHVDLQAPQTEGRLMGLEQKIFHEVRSTNAFGLWSSVSILYIGMDSIHNV